MTSGIFHKILVHNERINFQDSLKGEYPVSGKGLQIIKVVGRDITKTKTIRGRLDNGQGDTEAPRSGGIKGGRMCRMCLAKGLRLVIITPAWFVCRKTIGSYRFKC